MQWTTIAPAIFSLIGVIIGTAGSFTIGYATTRTDQNAHDLVMRL
jgi:hypothetical protein